MSEPQKLFASLSGALVAHLIFFLLVFGFLSTRSANSSSGGVDRSAEEEKPREVTVLMSELMEQVEVEPPPPPVVAMRDFVTTDLNAREESAPLNPRFQSDRNTSAASVVPPDENRPQEDGPTLAGKNPLVRPTLANRKFTEGKEPAGIPESTAASEKSIQSRDELLDRLEQEVEANTRKSFSDPTSDTNASDPGPMTKEEDRLARRGGEILAGETEKRPDQKTAEADFFSESFSPEERQNTINGGLVKTGQNAVDAEETPLGRYQKSVQDVISRMWHRYRQEKIDSAMWGILKFEFNIDHEGGVNNLQITKNEANAIVAQFPLEVVREAKLPPMPDDVAESVGPQGLVIRYDIITY